MKRLALALCLAAAPVAAGDVRVIDGDTFEHGDVTIRLWGVDAPEVGEPGAAEATRALGEILAGADLQCTPRGRSYGRVVARCWADGRDVAMELVCRGLARDWPRYSGGAYAECRG